MEFGLNLFSLRKQIATEEDFLATALKLKKMGYGYLQFSGAPFDGEMIARVSQKADMPMVVTHVPLDRIQNDENLVKEHGLFGCNYVGLGAYPFAGCKSDEEILKGVEVVREAAEKIKNEGGFFFYHNHNTEFRKLSNGVTIFDTLAKEIPSLEFLLDTYWLQAGGVSVVDTIEKMAGRLKCVHLKDYLPVLKEGKTVPKFAPVGDGNLDWHKIIPAFEAAGAEYYLVEQDDATDYEDPFEQVERSIKYLKNNF